MGFKLVLIFGDQTSPWPPYQKRNFYGPGNRVVAKVQLTVGPLDEN